MTHTCQKGNDDLNHGYVPLNLTIKDLNNLHPISFSHELTPCTKFENTNRKTSFRSVVSSFPGSFAMKLLGSFTAKIAFLQCKSL